MREMMEYIVAVLMLAALLSVAYMEGMEDGTDYGVDLVANSPLPKYWNCMDGCYNMLEVIYGDVQYDDSVLKGLHSECTLMCSEQAKVDEYFEEFAERYG